MTEPTEQDRKSAALRAGIAERFRREYQDAFAHAEQLFGPGWIPHGKHILVSHDEAARSRQAGDRVVPEAIVITARNGGQERHFTVEGGVARECARYEETWAEKLRETHPTCTFEHKGQSIPIGKYEIHWGGFEPDYRPASAEQLAAAREKREQKAEEKWQQEVEKDAAGSLFPEYVKEMAEEQRKKGRKR